MPAGPPLWIIGGLGFASGLPLPLSGFTLRYWLSDSGASLEVIGLTALIGLSYTLKFLWAPLLDGVQPFAARAGRRRGWLLLVQPVLAASIVALALSSPARTPVAVAALAALVAFLSATQDIAIDAWRIEAYAPERQGMALAAYVWGYRLAMLVSGAGAIGLSGPLGWHGALLVMAAVSLLGLAFTAIAPEARGRVAIARVGSLASHVRNAIAGPVAELLRRPGAVPILGFVLLFKLGEALAQTMAAPFYLAMGFNRAAVALATGVPALAASLAGAMVGGWLVIKLRPGRALVLTGFVQTASMTLYFALAVSGGDPRILFAKVILESFAEAMADAAFLTFLSNLCDRRYTATQYALLSSAAALGLRTVAGSAGFLADELGWVHFFALSIGAALPAMGLMLYLMRRYPHAAGAAPPDR